MNTAEHYKYAHDHLVMRLPDFERKIKTIYNVSFDTPVRIPHGDILAYIIF